MQSHEFCCDCCETTVQSSGRTESTAALSLIEKGWKVRPVQRGLGEGMEFQVTCPNCRDAE